jgi:hypothetical protein
MRSLALAIVLAVVLAAEIALAGRAGPVLLLAPGAVLFGVLAASCLLGDLTWLSVIAGAASPLVLSALAGESPWLALSGMTALWLAPRLWLGRDHKESLAIAATSLLAAGLAGWITSSFVAAVPLYHLTACVFGGATLALSTVIVPGDTLLACTLEAAARRLDGPVAAALREAAELHRSQRGSGGQSQPWRDLERLVEARLARKSGDPTKLDASVVAAVRSLVPIVPPAEPEAQKAPSAE